MTDRQMPKWSELKPLLRPKPITVNPTERRLEKALTIADLRAIAKRRTPRSVFDYTDGAAEAEISLRRARRLFAEMELQPSILRDVPRSMSETSRRIDGCSSISANSRRARRRLISASAAPSV